MKALISFCTGVLAAVIAGIIVLVITQTVGNTHIQVRDARTFLQTYYSLSTFPSERPRVHNDFLTPDWRDSHEEAKDAAFLTSFSRISVDRVNPVDGSRNTFIATVSYTAVGSLRPGAPEIVRYELDCDRLLPVLPSTRCGLHHIRINSSGALG